MAPSGRSVPEPLWRARGQVAKSPRALTSSSFHPGPNSTGSLTIVSRGLVMLPRVVWDCVGGPHVE
eukprot:1516134-Prymnesium_polylepis.1